MSSTDAVSAVEQAESNKGNNGVPWVGGGNAGGSGQGSIKVVGDVTRAGYNLLNSRGVTDTSSIPRASCGNRLTCQTWSSPQAAADFATRVLGEREQRTCETCTKTQTTPGVGLTPVIQEEYETKLQALQELVTGAKPTTVANLEAAGSNSLPITRGVIEALRDEPDQDLLGKRLASEAALSSVLEKALLLQRTLLTGKKEPNVAANELAVKAVDQENNALEQEINNLKTELELRRTLAGNSAMAIVQRHGTAPRARAASSRATRRATGSRKCRSRGAGHDQPDLAAAGMAARPPRRHRAAVGAAGGGHRGRRERRRPPRRRQHRRLGAVAARALGPLPRLAAAALRGDGLRLVVDASAPARTRAVGRDPSAPAARRDRGRRHPRAARRQPATAQWLSLGERHDAQHNGLPEYYLTLVGWIVSNGIWNILVASGVFALPFVVIVVQEWLARAGRGRRRRQQGVLSSMRIENRVWVAIVVILFAGIPFIPVDLSTIKFDTTRSAQCQVSVPQPTDTGWSNAYTTLNNQSALVPVWWFFMHAISKAVTGGAVAAIPCGTDLRQMRMDVDATRIDDPVLAQEVGDFVHDCYGPSRAKLFMSRPTLRRADERRDLDRFELLSEQRGLLRHLPLEHATHGLALRRDARCGLAQVDSGGATPRAGSGGRTAAAACARACWPRSIPTC